MLLIFKYWKYAAMAMLLVATFITGVRWEGYKRDSQDLVDVLKHRQELSEETQRSYDLGVKLTETTRDRDEYFNKLGKQKTKIVQSPVYSNECIDDFGRVLINEYLTGQSKNLPASGGGIKVPKSDSVGK